jgi:hypothetical protein
MKSTTLLPLLLLTMAVGPGVRAGHPWRQDHLGLSLHAGSFSLEGPAVTSKPDGGEQDVDMFGLRAEGHALLSDAWYARGVADLSRLDGEAGSVQANLSVGTIRALMTSEAWHLDGYLQAGVEYARSSDLDSYPTDPDFDGTGSGESGDDVGASVETGVSLGFRRDSRVDLFAKYLNFGDGDGPSFGVRLGHDLDETWTLTGGWDGVWVEDDGIQIDVAFRRFSVGALRKF